MICAYARKVFSENIIVTDFTFRPSEIDTFQL